MTDDEKKALLDRMRSRLTARPATMQPGDDALPGPMADFDDSKNEFDLTVPYCGRCKGTHETVTYRRVPPYWMGFRIQGQEEVGLVMFESTCPTTGDTIRIAKFFPTPAEAAKMKEGR